MEKRKNCVKMYLSQKGYAVNEEALDIISMCDEWYRNKEIDDFHVRKNLNQKEIHLVRMNFAKRCCADDANLCEIISVFADDTENLSEYIKSVLQGSRFDVQYRRQLEKVSASGTVGAYIYLQNAQYQQINGGEVKVRGGDVRINYVDADCIIPLTVENGLITECAFAGTNKVKCKSRTTLVIFTKNAENGLYEAETVVFDEYEKPIEEAQVLQLGEVKPFTIMVNAEVNNLDNMDGYGLPKVYNSIPLFKAADLCFSILYGDLSKGDKIVFINELLSCISKGTDGLPQLTPQQKDLFVMLGERLPDQDTLIKEYNPVIRVEDITKAFELVLSLLSLSFGYGTKKYTFENGQIKTATEYIGGKQDAIQELNKQRKQATDYITDIVRAAMWFSNQFIGTTYDIAEKINIEFDDSYIEDKQTKLAEMRADALSFSEIPWLRFQYIKTKYNLSDEEAKRYIVEGETEEEPNDDFE